MRTLGFDKNREFYKQSIEKYGISPKGVHWSSKYNQYIRFEIITEFIKEEIKESTLVDAGCGFSEYYRYLEMEQLLPKEYLGIDCEEAMIFRSVMRFPQCEFEVKNVLQDNLSTKDYYIASGSLNILKEKEFYTFIANCYEASTKGFIFNFLTKDSFNKMKKQSVLSYCEKLCSNIYTQESYLYNDMTIFMQKKTD